MSSENVMTFGMLLQVKREAMGLSQKDVERRIGVTGLGAYEKDKWKPQAKTMAKIMAFYKITEDEMQSLKTGRVPEIKKYGLSKVLDDLQEIIKKVEQLPASGLLAKTMRNEALEKLKMATECIDDVLIIDRLI